MDKKPSSLPLIESYALKRSCSPTTSGVAALQLLSIDLSKTKATRASGTSTRFLGLLNHQNIII